MATFCEACSLPAMRTFLDFLETLNAPAALVARDLTVSISNSRFQEMTKKNAGGIEGRRIGEMLDCNDATPDHPCGESSACLHCWLKRLIELVRLTGERLSETPISIQHKSGASQTFKVTTEIAGDAVLLKIRI